jgi:hypothetical protein
MVYGVIYFVVMRTKYDANHKNPVYGLSYEDNFFK